jgi:hypothetical protein
MREYAYTVLLKDAPRIVHVMMSQIILIGVLCVALALPAIAQTQKNPAVSVRIVTKTLEGKVEVVNLQARSLTLLTTNKTQYVITCSPECGFGDELDGLASLDELKVGEKVYVKCAEYDGKLTASRIARMKPQKAKVKKK